MISRERTEDILKDSGVLMEGHFILTSGRHSDKYMQCAQILQYPWYASELISGLEEQFKEDGADLVIAPATGGLIIGYELARQLNIKNLFTERVDGKMTLRRGFEIKPGEKCIVAEDVITTGGTVEEVMEIVRENGGVVVGVALLIDRSMGQVDFGVKKRAAYTADVVSWEADDCPLCRKGAAPALKPGSRGIQ